MIPDTKISEIRERIDIAEVIGDYLTLHKAGANLKGVCPFHADSDPSFNINPSRGFFHCFGCGTSGDVFAFLMKIEGIDFTDAATRLAGRAGVVLPEMPKNAEAKSREEKILSEQKRRFYVLEFATSFFEQALFEDNALLAREELKKRGISEETRSRFRLGYAPNAWSALCDHASLKQISLRDLESVGLIVPKKSGNGFYDRFRNRLMFPITDSTGRPIAFSGRALSQEEADLGAKYINSPETPEYKKGKVLFGLHQARVALSKYKEAVLVEGNFDVISLSQAGIENVVAPLGTALTEEQTLLLKRRVESVTVLFDGDSAGRKAAARAFPILAKAGLAAYGALLPPGEDPDSLVRKEGLETIQKYLQEKMGLFDQIINDTVAASDGSLQDKARRVEKLKPFLSALCSSLEIDLYRKKISDLFGIDPSAVFKATGGFIGRSEQLAVKDLNSQTIPGRIAERELMGLLLDCPEIIPRASKEKVLEYVTEPAFHRSLVCMINLYEKKEFAVARIVDAAEDLLVQRWLSERAMICLYKDIDKANMAFDEILEQLAKKPISEKIKELDYKIRIANAEGDDIRVLELSRKKADLVKSSFNSINSVSKFDLGTSSV